MAARSEPLRREVRLAAQLHYARRDLIGVLLLLVRVLEKLGRDALRMNTARHVVVTLIAQNADKLGRERLVEQLDHRVAVGAVAFRHRAAFYMLARALAQRLDVAKKRLVAHRYSLPAFPLYLGSRAEPLRG